MWSTGFHQKKELFRVLDLTFFLNRTHEYAAGSVIVCFCKSTFPALKLSWGMEEASKLTFSSRRTNISVSGVRGVMKVLFVMQSPTSGTLQWPPPAAVSSETRTAPEESDGGPSRLCAMFLGAAGTWSASRTSRSIRRAGKRSLISELPCLSGAF